MLKRFTLLIVLIMSTLLFTGSGEKEELTVYEENMKNFYTEISEIENAIAEIDESSENAVNTLLINMEEKN